MRRNFVGRNVRPFASGQMGFGGRLIGIRTPEKRGSWLAKIRELSELDMPIHANALSIAHPRDVASLA